ncbi:MAG: TolC family protein [Mariprofundaceae bacterium]|nr:TolC family protein [Mariprofundaceae bacterium]
MLSEAQADEITTLRQGVDYALQHNRWLAADVSAVEQARAGQDQANGRLMPRLDLSTGVQRTDAPSSYFGTRLNHQQITAADFSPAFLNNPGFINNYQTRLNVSMPIYRGGALWAGRRQADHQTDASIFNHDYMRQQVIFQTISAYVRTRQKLAGIHAVKSAVSAAEKHYKDTKALQKRGVLIDSDVMDARVHVLRSKLKLKQADNAYAQALEVLQRVMGLDSNGLLLATEEPHLAENRFTLTKAVAQALISRADLQGLEQAYQAALANIDYNKAAFLPHVDLVAGQEWNSSTLALKHRNTMIGATVRVNLFSGGSDKAKMRAAQAKLVALELNINDRKQQIRNEVAQAWRMLDESRARKESEREALKQSEESLRIKALRYEQGLAKTSDLLDAQLQVDQTRLSAIRANYDVTISQAALLLAVGVLNEGVIQ